MRALRWISSSRSDVGRVRKVNEDACLERADRGIWVVADGMGGHHAGDVASQAIVTAMNQQEPISRLSTFVDSIEARLQQVNDQLCQMAARQQQGCLIGSTVVVLLAFKAHCVMLWSGDSRAYRYRNGVLTQLTTDHSQVEEMVEQGLLLRENMATHPAANVITHAVGAAAELFLEVDVDDVEAGDTFLLCSDGLNRDVSDREIATLLAAPDIADISDALVNLSLTRGATDNVTVVVVRALCVAQRAGQNS